MNRTMAVGESGGGKPKPATEVLRLNQHLEKASLFLNLTMVAVAKPWL